MLVLGIAALVLPSLAAAAKIPIEAAYGTEAGCLAQAAETSGKSVRVHDPREIFHVTREHVAGFELLCNPTEVNTSDQAIYVRCEGQNRREPITTIATLQLDSNEEKLLYQDGRLPNALASALSGVPDNLDRFTTKRARASRSAMSSK